MICSRTTLPSSFRRSSTFRPRPPEAGIGAEAAAAAPLRLLVGATRLELEAFYSRLEGAEPVPLRYGSGAVGCLQGVRVAVITLGVGKVNTAAGLALAIASLRPLAVVQLGIGGAFPGAGLPLGSAAVASEEMHLDSGVLTEGGFVGLEALGFPLLSNPATFYNRIPVDSSLTAALGKWCSTSPLPFGTAETVTGTVEAAAETAARSGVAVESMEGAAAAQVCLALGVPFAEVRGISNAVGDRGRSNWRIAPALASVHALVTAWLADGASLSG